MKHIAGAALIGLAACSIQPGELADAATTAVVLADGGVELNPVLSWAGDAAPVVSIAAKQGAKYLLVQQGYEQETVDNISNSLSWGAACHNVVIWTGGAHPPGIALGLLCVWLTWEAV